MTSQPTTPKQMEQLLSQKPFLPLHLHLANGEVVEITNPRCVLIMGATLQVVRFKPGETHVLENSRYIPIRQIASVEQTSVA